MAHHSYVQETIASFFHLIDGEEIDSFKSSLGISYVVCKRNGLEWMFSVQTRDERSHYILTRSDMDKDRHLLVSNLFEDITCELEKLVTDPDHVIERNDEAKTLQ